jgi:hypothetical protein
MVPFSTFRFGGSHVSARRGPGLPDFSWYNKPKCTKTATKMLNGQTLKLKAQNIQNGQTLKLKAQNIPNGYEKQQNFPFQGL